MNKILIAFALFTFGLNAQSKLQPNIHASLNLGQTITDNTLGLRDSKYVINKVLLYNKETSEQRVYQNQAKSIAIDLDQVKTGVYTAMVYVNGDVKVFNLDIVGLSSSENYETTEAAEVAVLQEKKPTVEEVVEVPEAPVEVKDKKIKFYRVESTVAFKYSSSKYNVFTEKRKDALIRKNELDLTTRIGKKNTLVVYAVYLDRSEEMIYDTGAVKDFNKTLPAGNELSSL
ncbi:hypothetical protein [Algibacter lectus]|uniref:Uncharacterized protein n=1 Tax=Algibacter lectus TaxID=221126 RepID=A0A4R8ME07_9FLAO|nr:hypothetical protein [Algibacter lectus]MWW24060.1 hypothetical protein [Algibacter lectus]TDY62076.1 hypothetical protein DFQ06_1891 [Algibacter lectus]